MSTYPDGADTAPLNTLVTPPHDPAAEAAVLGSMMLSPEAAQGLAAQLRAEDFYRPANMTVFSAITGLLARGESADAVTVAADLMAAGDIGRIGGAPYLHTLVESVPVVASAPAYARIVQEHSRSRALLMSMDKVRQAIYGGTPYADVRDLAEREVFAVTDERRDGRAAGLHHRSEFLPGVLDTIEARGRGEQRGIPSGLTDLDQLTNGWQPGQLITVAGRPAMGKSALAGGFAEAAATAGHPVAVFSMEMTADELLMRDLSAIGRVPLTSINSGLKPDSTDWDAIARAEKPLRERPVYVDDSPGLTVGQMLTRARRLAASRVGLGLIVVDYLQLARGLAAENRQAEVADVSRSLKLMAKELHVPVIALAQLNRGSEQRHDKIPLLSDLRESGQIEQDSDVVVLIHRPDVYEVEPTRPGEADLIVAKHRNGPTGIVTVAASLHHARFRDMYRG